MRIVILFALLTLAFITELFACDCAGPVSPCSAAGNAAAAFTGTVLSIASPVSDSLHATHAMPTKPVPLRLVRLRVGSVLHGIADGQGEIEVGTGRGGGDCGYLFEVGREYVVYAVWNRDGWLETSICSGTRPLSDAATDLAYFRAMKHAPNRGSLRVHTWSKEAIANGNLTIALERNGTRLMTASVDKRGVASFPSLPPGTYLVHAEQDGDQPDDPTVEVRPKACNAVSFPRSPRITGTVVTSSGAPAANIELQALAVDDAVDSSANTNGDGRFELRLSQPGSYILGVNLTHSATFGTPYPRWYYPGTPDPAAATKVTLSGLREVQSARLILPGRLAERTISGVVLNPDGSPNGDADVRFLVDGSIQAGSSGGAGRFSVALLSGTRYRVHAIWKGRNGQPTTSAEPVDIEPGTDPVSLTMRLTRPGDSYQDEILGPKRSGQ
ncbi:carboxypeptidase-like regulatory domain-containing protein [uncultured Paludibaculum sp.]|uniref:carboxypeptidase-like regulatory domain-containing protein n=1 Tax=uncultured Paludibaculum sp. TaxID=1765020 RepID=UPI002AAC4CD2|nr:carboxypeptidase-like regulatory domain-containing protein [uncultured Paludibaculum sp.]